MEGKKKKKKPLLHFFGFGQHPMSINLQLKSIVEAIRVSPGKRAHNEIEQSGLLDKCQNLTWREFSRLENKFRGEIKCKIMQNFLHNSYGNDITLP